MGWQRGSASLETRDISMNAPPARWRIIFHSSKRTLQERLAYSARILANGGAGAVSAKSLPVQSGKCYWRLRFGFGFDEATPEDFIEVCADLKTVSGEGMANPATRFHLWTYEARADANSIIHTHSP